MMKAISQKFLFPLVFAKILENTSLSSSHFDINVLSSIGTNKNVKFSSSRARYLKIFEVLRSIMQIY